LLFAPDALVADRAEGVAFSARMLVRATAASFATAITLEI
jgi:hypothetical protein